MRSKRKIAHRDRFHTCDGARSLAPERIVYELVHLSTRIVNEPNHTYHEHCGAYGTVFNGNRHERYPLVAINLAMRSAPLVQRRG